MEDKGQQLKDPIFVVAVKDRVCIDCGRGHTVWRHSTPEKDENKMICNRCPQV